MYQRILVPVDGSATSQRGLQEAIGLARQTHGRIRLLHVVDQLAFSYMTDAYSGFMGDCLSMLRADGEKLLETAAATAGAAGVPVETAIHDGLDRRLHEVVEDEVRGWQAELIVIGTHGRRGASRLLLGSDAERILRTSTVPVLLVRQPEPAAVHAPAQAQPPAHVHQPTAALSFE
ncbi:universal stress protein [Xylophilus rhododendri]|uniref:Universal stress protein n=1 Tax=Xylophilus rhododendri TaxID=2697032 RepID=A0A857J0X6_9BURK|nr:universal stress protein [Xylophilus rhododendri]QHI97520.1 universal stress protein [Xylophilus rhododendri]